jgi:GrpB-like predicted nucleotidyltransferase (UPF0157 family)
MNVRNIIVESYHPKWKTDYEKIKAEIEPVISDLIIRMEHVGSTSVVGLSAKPIIDIDVVIKDYSVFDEIVERLNSIGYIHEGNLGIEGREAFKYDNKPHLQEHHLYVCPENSKELHRHITFRDYLRSNPDAAAKYGKIKMEAAKRYPNDIDKYLEYKSHFVQEIYQLCGLI